MKKSIVTAMSLFVLIITGSSHAQEELVWNPTHMLGSMVIGFTEFYIHEEGVENGVFSVVLEKDGTDNDFFDQLIVIDIPDSDRAMVVGILSGAGGVSATPINVPGPSGQSGRVGATPINVPGPSGQSGRVSATPINVPGPVVNTFSSVAMEYDPVPEPPPEGDDPMHIDHWSQTDEGFIAEMPDPGGHPPGPNMIGEMPDPGGTPPGPNMETMPLM